MAAMGAASHNKGVSIMTNNTNNKPVKQFRIGLISAAVWRREAGGNTFHSVTIDRSYKDEDGNWQRTNSLRCRRPLHCEAIGRESRAIPR
jgi:hypothetical protein